MNFALIICTYKRPAALAKLLESVAAQTTYPNNILIIDGSPDDQTRALIHNSNLSNLTYYKVDEIDRGLTKQRNFGIDQAPVDAGIVAFLDDDTILEPNYFKELVSTYEKRPDAMGVGGFITNEVTWWSRSASDHPRLTFTFDGYSRRDGARFLLRKKLNLDSNVPPGHVPSFGHGRSIGFLPPSGKVYPVEQLIGANFSFRKSVFDHDRFSTYFEGYGLYEDADFTMRISKKGPLYVNTSARMEHHHDPAGRPNHFRYGKMVVRNGWYVWRVAHPNPNFVSKLKWYKITILLIMVRYGNAITTAMRADAFSEAKGRTAGLLSIIFNAPKIN